jgi:hypothetical protein
VLSGVSVTEKKRERAVPWEAQLGPATAFAGSYSSSPENPPRMTGFFHVFRNEMSKQLFC